MSFVSTRGRAHRAVTVAGLLLLVALLHAATVAAAGATAASHGLWELKVCADPISLPFSSIDESGFENRIVEILADELNATVTYDWHMFNADIIKLRLRQGECDVLLGVPDGFSDLLSTITYYRSPYVFIYRADSGFDIESLDDESLRSLRIAVQSPGIPPHEALLNRGISENVSMAYGGRTGSADRLSDLVEAVAAGEVDVGIVWGPVGGYFARHHEVDLKIVPVTPEFEPPAIFMSVPMTMAVRPGDEALRDRLNLAIAARWDDIQAVLEQYGIPVTPSPAPGVGLGAGFGGAGAEEKLRIGVVLPTRSGRSTIPSSLYDVAGDAARMGALLAADIRMGVAGQGGPEIELLLANSPDAATARRAAQRLVVTENVHAVIGGLGEGQAEALAAVAEEYGIPFINVGSPELHLRENPGRYVFHVEASAGMYLDALVDWYTSHGKQRWFIVYEETPEGAALYQRALAALRTGAPHAEIVGQTVVAVEQPFYYNELYAARDADADVLLLLVHAVDQVAFLSQMSALQLDIAVAPYPDPVTQTRDFLASAHLRYDAEGLTPRVALWDTTLEADGADNLNMRFVGRWARPMDPTAWAAYQAVRVLHQSVAETGSTDGDDIVAYIKDPATTFELNKGQPLAFGADDHQLYQPLYVVQVDEEAEWDLVVFSRVNFARVLAEMPGDGGVYGENAGATGGNQ